MLKMNPFKKEKPGVKLYEVQPHEIPAIRVATAIDNGCQSELCFVVGGGLGDRVCAEPTLRFALNHFKDVRISLICDTPSLFRHLNFHEVFDLKKTHPIVGRHLYLYTYATSPLMLQIMNPNFCHAVDAASITAFRMQLPPENKELVMKMPDLTSANSKYFDAIQLINSPGHVVLHLGKSWASRTFPAPWWREVISELRFHHKIPVLIGNNCIEGIEFSGCVDLRDRLTLDEYVSVCLTANHLITNDSSPLHIAAAGNANIAFVSTCRRGDLLMHVRNGELGWRMKDFAFGEMWAEYKFIPNFLEPLSMADIPRGKIENYLPTPSTIVNWIRREE